ncbi:MAG: helix-turn-helix domain-containing protein [Fimbriimonadaceae bacterium]
MQKHKPQSEPDLGAALRRRRKALGMSQDETARLSGCGRLFISEVERGKRSVRLDKLIELLRTLGLQLEIRPGRDEIRIDESI